MFRLRKIQMKTLAQTQYEEFIEGMILYLQRFFPSASKTYTLTDLRLFIAQGIKRANEHGFDSKRDLCKYICLRMHLGPDFEDKPESAWMKGFFRDPDVPRPGDRITRVVQEQIRREERRQQIRRMWEDFSNERSSEIQH